MALGNLGKGSAGKDGEFYMQIHLVRSACKPITLEAWHRFVLAYYRCGVCQQNNGYLIVKLGGAPHRLVAEWGFGSQNRKLFNCDN